MEQRSHDNLKSIMLLAGAFFFAFLLGEMIHEFGHYLTHRLYGNLDVQLHLDPFGGTRMVGVTSLPLNTVAITSAAGPLFHLIVGMVSFPIFLWKRTPLLLPVLLVGPVAMVQEGVTFSIGLLTPGGDAQWIAAAGISQFVILLVGILLLVAGLGAVSMLLPLAGIKQDDSTSKKISTILWGMCSLMLVRAIHSVLFVPQSINENMIPLIFSGLLAVVVVLLQRPIVKIGNLNASESPQVTWSASVIALILGVSVFVLQIFAYN